MTTEVRLWSQAEKELLWQYVCEGRSSREIEALMPDRSRLTINTMRTKIRHEKNGTRPAVHRVAYDEKYGEAAVKRASDAFAAAFRRPSAA